MSTGYRIKEVADRSGFTPATLRYYEELGLLPVPGRTPSGYRMYDDASLDRLAFIARAKQLGCSLEEIGELLPAWEGERCGPVQDRLRSAVAGKLAQAQEQIAALVALTADLQRAAAALQQHRPDGPCDERCGCVSDPEQAAAPVVLLTSKPATPDDAVPVACSLSANQLQGRLADWSALLAHVERREARPGGVRLVFSPSARPEQLMRLATAEHDCCRFFAFIITMDTRGLALEVTAPADALPLVTALFGAPA